MHIAMGELAFQVILLKRKAWDLFCFVQQPGDLRPRPSEQYKFQFYCFEYSSVIWNTPAENYHHNNNSTIIGQCKDTPENQLQQRSRRSQFAFLSLVTGTADEIMRPKTFARILRENKIKFSWTIILLKRYCKVGDLGLGVSETETWSVQSCALLKWNTVPWVCFHQKN